MASSAVATPGTLSALIDIPDRHPDAVASDALDRVDEWGRWVEVDQPLAAVPAALYLSYRSRGVKDIVPDGLAAEFGVPASTVRKRVAEMNTENKQ